MGASLEGRVAFFQESFGLNTATALLLHKADNFMDKNELKKAEKFYQAVLTEDPQCTYAAKNATIVMELLVDEEAEEQRRQLQSQVEGAMQKSLAYTKTEMSVSWNKSVHFDASFDPDIDKVATEAIIAELMQMGFSRSILSLKHNEVISKQNNEWTYEEWSGRANFQVLFVPDEKEAPLTTESGERAIQAVIEPSPQSIGSADASNPGPGSSKFADASEGSGR
ncbi:expressed unknown protein [Seminavis robusta]|uniref:Uncharacterized protein n=1 Tax=Seminavis robusta TaxID=568900 RepID=A0A9N8HTS3_9STRA|nr:expressed unknown protein [Seminavis robusta]|eukprot:Sro1933_g306220.1 n/a (224) ;mRNA; r:3659-4330